MFSPVPELQLGLGQPLEQKDVVSLVLGCPFTTSTKGSYVKELSSVQIQGTQ